MKLTALEIKKQQFEKSLRGYDKGEVDAFLQLVSSEWEHMTGKIRQLEQNLEKYEERIRHFERVEGALHETLMTAKDSADEKLLNARKQAQNIIEKAEMEAEGVLTEAHRQRKEVRQDTLRLLERREEMIHSIRSYLDLAQQSLKQFSADEASLFRVPPESEGDEGGSRVDGRGGSERTGIKASAGSGPGSGEGASSSGDSGVSSDSGASMGGAGSVRSSKSEGAAGARRSGAGPSRRLGTERDFDSDPGDQMDDIIDDLD